jgi:1,4-dihydroxy-2-naphthoate octaprenyltransferase
VPIVFYFNLNFRFWIFLPYLTLPMAFKLSRMLFKSDGKELNNMLELTAQFSGIFGLLFSAGILL